MRVDFSKPILTLGGVPVKDGDGITVYLRDVCAVALGFMAPEDSLDAKEKYRRGSLAKKIYKESGPMDLPENDIRLLKAQIGRAWNIHVVTEAWDMLDPDRKIDING